MDSGTIVLKNIRRDIPALKPLAAKIIYLQKRLIEAVQRYQELRNGSKENSNALQELLGEIRAVDQEQREQLELVREAERTYRKQSVTEALYCKEDIGNFSTPVKSEDDSPTEEERAHSRSLDYHIEGSKIVEQHVPRSSSLPSHCTEETSHFNNAVKSEDNNSAEEEGSHPSILDYRIEGSKIVQHPATQDYRIEGTKIVKRPQSISSIVPSHSILNIPNDCKKPLLGKVEEEPCVKNEQEDTVMDWNDLAQEQWSETDKLLQKVERVGSKVLQQDFLSTIDLVHVSQYKQAEDCLLQRKLRISHGKAVPTGPWQIFDVPTKVTNRRCNYLASGLHVTVRQKDPQRCMTTAMETGMKTRHHDSRGSSRTSSRASSPMPANLADSCHHRDAFSLSNKSRSMKTRASKTRKAAKSLPGLMPNRLLSAATNSSASTTVSSANSTPAETASKGDGGSLEPCVTYTVVDGIPHFKVFLPSSKETTLTTNSTTTTTTTTSSASKPTNGGPPIKDLLLRPPASIVESGIEILNPDVRVARPSRTRSPISSLFDSGTSAFHDRKLKLASKVPKRSRLSQSYISPCPKAAGLSGGESVAASGSTNHASRTKRDDNNKEDFGLCIEKCGSWMGSPHFKIFRTFPSINSTSASSVADWSVTSPMTTVTTDLAASAAKTSSSSKSPGQKMTTPSPSTPKLSVGQSMKPANHPTRLAMPKLTMGPMALRTSLSSKTLSTSTLTNSAAAQPSKLVPIAPKVQSTVSNFVLVPFSDKNQSNHQPTKVKRSITMLKPPHSKSLQPSGSSSPAAANAASPAAGALLTVKNIKECLKNSIQYKDMKLVVQKVPPASTVGQKRSSPVAVDVKKKRVKFSPPCADQDASAEESQANHSVPTVIVADMSI